MNRQGILMIISGFSGSGKGTVVQRLMELYEGYVLSVSATTRDPRPGEKDGVHYFFVSEEKFGQMVREEAFVEYARYVDHGYGTPRAFVEEKLAEGYNVVLEIEVQGALQVKEKYPDAAMIFITPPSIPELVRRLTDRGSETREVIAGRLARAKEESEWISSYDYVVVNDKIDLCAQRLHEITQSLKSTVSRSEALINRLRKEVRELDLS